MKGGRPIHDPNSLVRPFLNLCRDRIGSAIEERFPYGIEQYDLPEYRQVVRAAASAATMESPHIELIKVRFDTHCALCYDLEFRIRREEH